MERLLVVLERARHYGFLGPGPVDVHVAHARGFAAAAGAPPRRFVDLGAGGGVPGLPLACTWSSADGVLVDSSERRTAFLAEALEELELGDRVVVVRGRAEDLGRDPGLRETAELVVARGFGPPPVTAECAAPFLRVGGTLVVSEPPEGPSRWDTAGLAKLGLEARDTAAAAFRFFTALQRSPCPQTYPRRSGIPRKRPLW